MRTKDGIRDVFARHTPIYCARYSIAADFFLWYLHAMTVSPSSSPGRQQPSRKQLVVRLSVGGAIFLFLLFEAVLVQQTFSARGNIMPKIQKDTRAGKAANKQEVAPRNPDEFEEVPIGPFHFATACQDDSRMLHVYSRMDVLVAATERAQFQRSLDSMPGRIREQVFMVLRTTHESKLTDPNLSELKRDLAATLNDLVDGAPVKGVLFPEYHFDFH